jgi:hypothetical protein
MILSKSLKHIEFHNLPHIQSFNVVCMRKNILICCAADFGFEHHANYGLTKVTV